jgi:uncharacterized membrane protein HdeD (DUF308 family)
MMNELLSRAWWLLAVRGAVALLFGLLALLWPGMTLLFLVAIFATYALIGGTVSLVGAIKNRQSDDDWWLVLLLGLVSIGAGVIAILHPDLTTLVLVLMMGATALMSGVLDIAVAIRLRRVIRHEWLLGLSGTASIVFGVAVFLFPGPGALALVWLISLHALLTGVLLLAAALRLRSLGRPRGHGGNGKRLAGAS